MDKDRVVGAAHEAKGTVKEAVGKAVGDTKSETSNNRAFSEAGSERLFGISDRVMPVIWV